MNEYTSEDFISFLELLPRKNKGKRDRGYFYQQRQRIIKKRMAIASKKGLNSICCGKLSKSRSFTYKLRSQEKTIH